MIGRRGPVLAILLALGAAAVVVDPLTVEQDLATGALNAAGVAPLATAADAGSSTWFCAGGSAAVTGVAEQTITVANPTDAPASGTVQIFLEGQDATSVELEVAAHDQTQLILSTVVQGEWASALVELDRGGLVVSHDVLGVGGWDSDRCSSQAAGQWYFPWGQTNPQEASSMRLALFNPFPAEAVVDITFDTDDGFRAPEALQGFLVPARRLVTVDVTNTVPVRQRISTSIVARSGRLVADRIQTLTGTDGTVALDVTPGAPAPATSWYFADGRVDAATFERIAVFNPSEDTAQVEIEVQRPRVAQQLAIEPFELQIPPQSYAEVVLNDEGRVPKPLRHSTVVRSLNNVPVVAERVQLTGSVVAAAAAAPDVAAPDGTATTAADPNAGAAAGAGGAPAGGAAGEAPSTVVLGALPAGLAASLGSPVVATGWVVALAARADAAESKVVVLNALPDQPVTLSLSAWSGGVELPLTLASGANVLEGRQQFELPLTVPAGSPPLLLVVRADGPVVVDLVQVYGPLPDLSFSPAVPMPDGVQVPDALGPVALPPASATSRPGGAAGSPGSTSSPTSVASTATVAVATTPAPTAVITPVPTTAPPTTAPTTAAPTTAVASTPEPTAAPDPAAPTSSVPGA